MGALLASLVVLSVGCGDDGGSDGASAPARDRSPVRREVERPVDSLSLERQVGQLLMLTISGTELPDYARRAFGDGLATGVVLFGSNAPDEDTLKRLTAAVQKETSGSALVAADQEGGEVRVIPFAGPEPGASTILDAEQAENAARDGAKQLESLGVNLSLAPVADVAAEGGSAIGGRAYSQDAGTASELVAATVRGYREGNVAAAAKHFPGFGAATANTDDQSVTIERSREEIEETDLRPFRAAIEARVPMVMVSHAMYPAYDPKRIASQSPQLLGVLLRQRLRFKGVIITDSIEAQAVLDQTDVETAAVRSIRAGVDLILMTGPGTWPEVYRRVLAEAKRSPEFRRRVRSSAERVIGLKEIIGLRLPPKGPRAGRSRGPR